MTAGTFTVDGVPLDDPAGRWMVSDETRLSGLAAPRLSDVRVPGRHGSLATAAATYASGSQVIGVIVTDADADGVPRGHQQLLANKGALFALCAPTGRLPTLRYIGDGVRVAAARLAASVDPELADYTTVKLVFPFDLPGVFWRDEEAATLVSELVTVWVAEPLELDGSTGPIVDPVFICEGPLTKVVVADKVTGRTLKWEGALAAGQSVRLDAAEMTAHRLAAPSFDGPGVDVSGGLTEGADPFELTPNSTTLRAGWTLTRTGGAGINYARVRRAFL
jgi:hypothetical protein